MDATFKLICIAAYAAYVLIGLAVAVVGAVYWSSTLIASGMVSALLIISGIGMVGVGAAACFSDVEVSGVRVDQEDHITGVIGDAVGLGLGRLPHSVGVDWWCRWWTLWWRLVAGQVF